MDPEGATTPSSKKKHWEYPWTVEEMKKAAGQWNLASDVGVSLWLYYLLFVCVPHAYMVAAAEHGLLPTVSLKPFHVLHPSFPPIQSHRPTNINSFIHFGYLYSTPSRNLLRGSLSPTTAKEKCLEKLAEKRHIVPGQEAQLHVPPKDDKNYIAQVLYRSLMHPLSNHIVYFWFLY